jgi:hypothetical protein
VAISSVVQQAGLDRPGVNIGGIAPYGTQQMLRDYGMSANGYFQPTYWQTVFPCTTGGTNDSTHWYNSITNSAGYPANFWAGATYFAVSAATGTLLGSGSITASSSNTSSGTQFTLGSALSSPCSTASSAPDMLIVKLTHPSVTLTPQQALGSICPAATFNLSDTSPASANTYQSLEMPSGCALSLEMDQVLQNGTNANPALAAMWQNWIDVNGSYTATFKAKCLTACAITYLVSRGNGPMYVPPTTISPAVNASPGQGWTTFSASFTGSEVGNSDYGNLTMQITVDSGTALIQDATVIEGSALSANNTVYRDAWVRKLQSLHPGSLRFMDGSDWCSTVADMTETAGLGGIRSCGSNSYTQAAYAQGVPYWDKLQLCLEVGADCWLTVGMLNTANDWTNLVNWLADPAHGPTAGTSWIQAFAAAGYRIYLEDGNENWNTTGGPSLWSGGGAVYGYVLGQHVSAAKAASGYDGSVVKLVGNSWAAAGQGNSAYGWAQGALTAAGCSATSTTNCPDFMDTAPYLFGWLHAFDTNGSNVSTTGSPFLDMWAEASNADSVPGLPCCLEQSIDEDVSFMQNTFGIPTAVYEVNTGLIGGDAHPTQSQVDQIAASVGEALQIEQHLLLMQRDAGVTGPQNVFLLAQNSYYWNWGSTLASPVWGIVRTLACGPGQLNSCSDVDRPLSIAMQIVNRALASNNNLMKITQTGTPTFSYPGGQNESGWGNTILANSAVPYVNCFAYADLNQVNWTTICFNNNLTASETVNFTGPGSPAGSVTRTVFPNAGNLITDHNENSYIGSSSASPTVVLPASTASGATAAYSIPPASMIVLTYSVGGAAALATPTFSPGSGTYSESQSVTIDFPSGSTGCVGINTLPAPSTPGTCGSGDITYSGPITVAASETLNAIATEVGYADSATGSADYVIAKATVATPTFSPAAGTYSTSQTLIMSDTTPGAVIYYTTDGSAPTTSSTVYTAPLTVSASETISAIAVAPGMTSSPVTSASFVIQTATAAPLITPAGGTYTSPQTVSITDTTAGAVIYYTTNGSAPTTSSTVYAAPLTVSTSETISAIAVAAPYEASPAATATFAFPSAAGLPDAPTALQARANGSAIALNWTAPASGGSGSYNVYRGNSAGGETTTPIATAVGPTYWTDNNVPAPGTWYYTVAAVDPAGIGPMSNEASATTAQGSFQLSAAQTSASIAVGQTAAYSLTLISSNYSGTVLFTCSGAPAGLQCTPPPSVQVTSGMTSTPVTVTVTATSTLAAEMNLCRSRVLLWSVGIFLIPFGFRRKSHQWLALLLVFVSTTILLTGCGSVTANRAATLTVTATGSAGGVASQTLTVTVQ